MTRVKHHRAGRGAMMLVSAVVTAAAASAVLAQAADEPTPLVGGIPDMPEVILPDAQPEAAATEEPTPEPEADADEDAQAEDQGVRLSGNLPAQVAPNPERRITVFISETLSGDTDFGLDGGGGVLGSNTQMGLKYLSIGPISSFNMGASLGFSYFVGPGAEDADLKVPAPVFSFGWQRSVSRTTQVSLGFNGSLQPEIYAEDPTFTLTDADGDGFFEVETSDGQDKDALRLSLAVSAGLSHTINSLNSVSLSVNASKTDYFDGSANLTPDMRFGLNGGWTSQLSPTVSGGMSAGVSAYFSDGADERQTTTFNLSGNTAWTVNRRLSVNASLGPNLSFNSLIDAGTGQEESYSTLSARAQFGMNYTLRDTSWSVGLSQGVQPTSGGSVSNTTALTIQMQHQVNDLSSVSVGSALSYRLPLSSQDEASVSDELNLNLRATYNYALTQDVNASLGYGLRWSNANDESFVSHKVFLTLTKSFTFLP